MVFGVMRDKAVREIAEILFPLAERVIATRAENPRAASADEIAAAGEATGTEMIRAENVRAALELARKLSRRDGIVVITGSIYIVGEALALLAPKTARQMV